MGAYDYVFAAKVEEIIDTEYPYREEYTLDSGETVTTGEIPYTRFSLTITECIKGQMAFGPSFPDFPSCELLKMGGYNEDRDTYYLCPMDVYPQVGEEYLFFAKQNTADLVLEAAAPQTAIPLSGGEPVAATYSVPAQVDRQSVIHAYADAYENEILLENETLRPYFTTVDPASAVYPFDVTDKRTMAGYSDVVFTGTIEELDGCKYPYAYVRTDDSGFCEEYEGLVHTELSVCVTEVIKGEVKTGAQVKACKAGGYEGAKDSYILLEHDFYPVEGKEYLFLGKWDGELLYLLGPYACVPLEADAVQWDAYSEEDAEAVRAPDRQGIIEEYREACANEIPY